MPIIKRYPNRKLYNTETNRYITLDQIADLIRQGEEVHVTDYATGEDLTALTLTQVLFEQAKKQTGFLPRHLLTDLIQAGESRISAIQRTLAGTISGLSQVNDEINRRIQLLVNRREITVEEGVRWLEKLMSVAPKAEEPPSLDEQVVEKILDQRGAVSRDEMDILFSRLDELTRKLDEFSSTSDQTKTDDEVGRQE